MAPPRRRRWTSEEFARPAEELAPALLGQLLVRVVGGGRRIAGVIVETEAYLGEADRAAHSFGRRRTARVASMYARAGTAYVYFTYGMHHCMNIVVGRLDEPVAVLLRALEPAEGLDEMRSRRTAGRSRTGVALRERDLCSGPAKLCQALGIDRVLDGVDTAGSGELWLEHAPTAADRSWTVQRDRRVGIDRAGAWADEPLRWLVDGHPCVSRPVQGPRRA